MADIKSPEERSRNMAAIKRSDTSPELFVRKLLFSAGYRYRIQSNSIPGHPDIWMKKYNTAVFIHGCFWHRHKSCKYAYMPKSRVQFWTEKFLRNEKRDQEVLNQLWSQNIRCLIIWECTIKSCRKKTGSSDKLLQDIVAFLGDDCLYREL